MYDWPAHLSDLLDRETTCATVTVSAVRGSAPREVGSKLWISKDSSGGTIGGGYLEHSCQQLAREALQAPAGTVTRKRFALGSQCGQCCGGVVDVLIETFGQDAVAWLDTLSRYQQNNQTATLLTQADGSKTIICNDVVVHGAPLPIASILPASGWTTQAELAAPVFAEQLGPPPLDVAIFGAGHVGRACAQVLATLDARVVVVDSRQEYLAGDWPTAVLALFIANPVDYVARLDSKTLSLVMTHDHALDLQLCDALLNRASDAFFGLIGSRSKQRRFAKKLTALGHDEAAQQRLTCPIGIDQVSGKQPGEIAIAVSAQILSLRSQAKHENLRVRAVS